MTLQELAVYKTADEDKRREIESYIAEIPDPQTREMFRLHFIGGYSYERIYSLKANSTIRNKYWS